ncbi:hypothetical protein J2Z53_001701 [Clostridium moniliforme]|uniref:ABC-three component systems C-terminal domain-containing protein n=1 Tax=Clostridium moniliforme TaxID=39489 RepID=A0ABS4F201_9CLOT|nr:ABC-three component system protein [Clostridium moniliforme]MBP1890117.1 hypothetical protein [Clostridium moniliforme]
MSETELFEYDAVPTWGGFIYQGYVAIYIALKYILDGSVREEEMSNYELRLERLEDVSVVYKKNDDIEYLSIHQVKSKKNTTLNSYMEALKQLMYEKAAVKLETREVQAYLHVRKNISDIKMGDISEEMDHVERKVKQTYRIIKKYAEREKNGKLTTISRKRLLEIIKKNYFSINRSKYTTARDEIIKCLKDGLCVDKKLDQYIDKVEEYIHISDLNSDVKVYKYKDKSYIEYGDLEREIQELIKEYTSKNGSNYSEDEIKYIYYLLTERVINNITERHKTFGDKAEKGVIIFSEIISILNDSLDNYEKKLNILALKNVFYKHIYEYCDTECEDICSSDECKLKNIEKELLKLSEEDFGGFCNNLNPDCTWILSERECINGLMQEYGILNCFFKGIHKIKSDYIFEDNRCIYNINKVTKFLSGIFVMDKKSLKRVIERIETNVKDNRKKEDLANLFEADQIIVKGAEADSSIWNSEVIKSAYEKEIVEKEKNYFINFKNPEIVDVDKIISGEK